MILLFMSFEMSALDLHFMVVELQQLVGSRFQKAYGLPREVYLQFHQSGEGKFLVRARLPGLIHLSEQKPEFPKNPPGFVMSLRKHLSGARLQAVEQISLDRVVRLVFVRGLDDEHVFHLVFELLVPGNALLVDATTNKILSVLSHQQYKDRVVRPGAEYVFPPAPDDLTKDDDFLVQAALKNRMDSLVKSLAVSFSLGGYYAELVCSRASLDKEKKDFDQKDLRTALKEARKLLEEKPTPAVVDAKIIPFSQDQKFSSLSQAIDSVIVDEAPATFEKKPKKPKKTIKEMQLIQKKGFEVASDENQRKGELVYEHYQEIQEALDSLKKGATPASKHFKEYDKNKRELVFEFPDN